MSERLSAASLGHTQSGVRRFSYDRPRVTPGIVHLGIGAFHRAHQAVVTDDLLASDPNWGIVGASLRRPDTRDALAPQDGLYTLLVRDGGGTSARIIGAVLELLDAPNQKPRLLARMSDAATRIVSLTVTEKGYCYDAASGGLDTGHPQIIEDLANPANPQTAPGLIVEALRQRRAAGIAPFTVLSCDNLPHNGTVAARVVTELALRVDPALGEWVKSNVAFPATMIDRIVPATTEADREEAREITRLEDAWPVVTEPFLQWVIEDRFVGERPRFELGGAEFVSDVAPYETMKLRMLNGAHSMIAYLGYLGGHEFVSQVIADPSIRRFIENAWAREIAPTLSMRPQVVSAYAETLLKRFSNPALKHRTMQIAMDGSQKLPQRLVGTIGDRLKLGQPVERLALGVAAWITYASGTDLQGRLIVVDDPMRAEFESATARAGGNDEALIGNFLALSRVFTEDVRNSKPLREALLVQYRALHSLGAAGAAFKLA
ncbi:MAG: mannitol dehydrogenase family protein [Devosia sp.]